MVSGADVSTRLMSVQGKALASADPKVCIQHPWTQAHEMVGLHQARPVSLPALMPSQLAHENGE